MSTSPLTDFRSVDERSVRIVIPSLVSTQIDELERLWKAPDAYLYTAQVDIETEIAKQRQGVLETQAAVWGGISLLLLAALIFCLVKNLPYEPAAALLACTVGLVVIFVMKLGDAKQ